jgi:hypothetical protein
MATLDTDVATAEVGDDASPGFSGTTYSQSTQQRTSDSFSTAKDYAQDVAGRAKEQGRAMFDEQKQTAAGTVDSAANAFRTTAQQMRNDGQAQTGRYVEMVADQLQSLGSQLRNKNLDTLIRDAENFGRRSPGTFLAGSMVAGFVLARFLKSSSEHRYESSAYDDRDSNRRDASSYAGDRSSFASDMPAWPRDERDVLRDRPNTGSGTTMTDADMSGSVMEGSDIGSQATGTAGLAGVTRSPSPIATANEALIEGERHDNR